MCCTRLAEIQDAKVAKNSPSGHHRTTLSGCIFATKAYIDNRKKLLNNNISSTCPHNMVNFGPLAAEIGLPVWGTSANFNGFRVLPSLLQRRRSPEANQTLHDVWPSPGLVHYYIHFRGLLPPDRILSGAKFTLRPSLAFSYIGSVTAQHSSSGRQENFAAWYMEWNYGTSAEGATYIWLGGHHVWHRPTFSFMITFHLALAVDECKWLCNEKVSWMNRLPVVEIISVMGRYIHQQHCTS